GHFTDLRDLSSCEDLHRRLSITLTLTRSWSYQTQGQYDSCAPLLALLTDISVLLAGCGCRPDTNNLGRGITIISFYVAEVQFLLIRALLNPSAICAKEGGENPQNGKVSSQPFPTDHISSLRPEFGVLTLGGGACATSHANGPILMRS
ncbi:MAG: hypothetical protein ACYC4U_32770, partial [Pirellulaceae bacterium]